MMKKLTILILISVFSATAFTGCYQMGQATGETAEEVEQGAGEFEEGYEEGYEEDAQ